MNSWSRYWLLALGAVGVLIVSLIGMPSEPDARSLAPVFISGTLAVVLAGVAFWRDTLR